MKIMTVAGIQESGKVRDPSAVIVNEEGEEAYYSGVLQLGTRSGLDLKEVIET